MFEWHRRKQSAGGIARRPQYTIELTYTVEVYSVSERVYYPNTNTFESGTHDLCTCVESGTWATRFAGPGGMKVL